MIYDYLLKYGFKPNNIGLNYLADIINLGIKGENLEPLSRVGYKLIADKYKKNIFMPSTFNKTLGITLDDKLPKTEDTNSTLERLLNYPELISKVAKGDTLNADITKVNSLVNRLEAEANITNFAYTLDGVDFSKNKFVNSLKLAVSSNLELPDEKLIVAALLYNTRKNEKDITTVLRHFNLV